MTCMIKEFLDVNVKLLNWECEYSHWGILRGVICHILYVNLFTKAKPLWKYRIIENVMYMTRDSSIEHISFCSGLFLLLIKYHTLTTYGQVEV
jgi:hypothetical protein